jgi:hypothetical protein
MENQITVFSCFLKIPRSDCWLRRLSSSVRMKNSATFERIFMKFDIDYFSKICRENSSFNKIGQE